MLLVSSSYTVINTGTHPPMQTGRGGLSPKLCKANETQFLVLLLICDLVNFPPPFSLFLCRCTYVLASGAPGAAALLTRLTDASVCHGSAGRAGCGGCDAVHALGSEERQEPLCRWGCDDRWTFQPVLYSFSCTAGIHSAATL